MPYGNITGYEPVEDAPGAYRFQTTSGDSPMFFGSEAEALKQKIDAANQSRQLLASNDANMSEAPPVAADATPNMTPNPGPAQSAPAEGGMSSINEDPSKGMSVAPEAAPANQSTQPQQNMSPNPGSAPKPSPYAGYTPVVVNGVNTGYVRAPDGRIGKITGPSAGSPGGPVQKTETRAGGFTPSQEYIDRQEDLHFKKQAALEVATEAAQQQAAEQQAFLHEQQRQQAIAMAEAQKRQVQIDARVQQLQAKYDKAVQEYTTTPKPGDDRSALQMGLDALAGFFGGIGAAINKSPNYALDMVKHKIDANIHAQEVALNVKKEAAGNALGDLTRELGSQDLAKTALKGIQIQQAKTSFDMIAAKSADANTRAKALEASAKLDEEYANTMEAYRQQSAGHVTKSYVVAPKVAPSKGGVQFLTPEKAMALAGTTAETEGKVATTAKTIDSVGKEGGGKAGTVKAQKLADIASSKAQLAKFENTWVKAGKPGVFNTGYLGSDTSQDLGAQLDAMAPGLGRVAEGNAPNESTMKGIRESMLSGDPTKIEAAINAWKQMLTDREKSISEGPDNPPAEEPDNKGSE